MDDKRFEGVVHGLWFTIFHEFDEEVGGRIAGALAQAAEDAMKQRWKEHWNAAEEQSTA